MPIFMPIIFVGFIALVIVLAIVGHQQAKKRREALGHWAHQHGLSYWPAKDHDFEERYPFFDCLKTGSNRYAHNIIEGEWDGRHLVAFDYHYETHSTDSKGNRQTRHHHFSAVILRAKTPLKPLIIRAENLFDRIGSVFGFDDIDFESAEFSRRFCVKAEDRKWAYDVLHARAMEFLMQSPQFSIEFGPLHVIAWRGRTFKVEDLRAACYVVDGLLDRLPEYVRQQQLQGV